MKIAIVGATGLVGGVMIKVLEERNFPVSEIIFAASEKSAGKILNFKGENVKVVSIADAISAKPQIAIFSAGGSVSEIYAPKFAEIGCFVIDNSSAWRMSPDKRLIIPEINSDILTVSDKIIANPNCSTIQMLMVLAPLHRKHKIKRLVISTYQSITGTGVKAVNQMNDERNGIDGEKAYPHPIDKNCIPHCDVFDETGYTKEETKLVNETRKILNDYNIGITATSVRVPVVGGHSEAVNVEFENEFELSNIYDILNNADGVKVLDDIKNNIYPMPVNSEGKDDVFVGRIRKDFSQEKTLNLWITADNLRKGAAVNAVQIAEYITDKFELINLNL